MPDGWDEATLGDLAKLDIGRTPPRKEARFWTDDLTYPFLSIAEMNSRTVDPVKEGVTEEALAEGKAKLVPAGSLLMSFKLTIGKIAFAGRDLCTNEAIVRIDPLPESGIDKRFLALALEHADLTEGQSRAVKGSTLNKGSLSAVRLPVPPPEAQRRIVDLIERVDLCVDAARRATAATGRLLTVARDDLMEKHETSRLGSLLLGVEGGQSIAGPDDPPTDGDRAILKVSAIQPGRFVGELAKRVPDGVELPDKYLVRSGDVLMTRSNTPDRVGFACYVRDDPPRPTYLPDLVFRLVPDPTHLFPAFLSEVLCTTSVRAQVMGSASGTSASMRKINKSKVRDYEVPAPPLEVQNHVVETLEVIKACLGATGEEAKALSQLRLQVLGPLMLGEHRVPETYDRLLATTNEQAA